MSSSIIRETTVAGQFYTDNPYELESQINTFIKNTNLSANSDRHVQAVILPHAGYFYSGEIAAKTLYSATNRKYKRIIILCPSHYIGFSGLALPAYHKCKTPLGDIAVDLEYIDKLSSPEFVINNEAHKYEHSLEVQLPLIKKFFPDTPVVPIVCGQTDDSQNYDIARTLQPLFEQGTLWLISSDFTHYGASFNYLPFDNNIKEKLYKLDHGAIDKILAIQPEDFINYVRKTGATICGTKPITILLTTIELAVKNGNSFKSELVEYKTSGDITGDFNHCVSYAGILFYNTESI